MIEKDFGSWYDIFEECIGKTGVQEFQVSISCYQNLMWAIHYVPWETRQAAYRDGTFTMYDPRGRGATVTRGPK